MGNVVWIDVIGHSVGVFVDKIYRVDKPIEIFERVATGLEWATWDPAGMVVPLPPVAIQPVFNSFES